jgi:hypothetical protein
MSAAYRRFAEQEAHGKSALYEALAHGVSTDPETLAYLLTLPVEKRQPNLLLAAVRHLCGTAANWPAFRTSLLANSDAVRACMLEHATQTNEPARCTTLLPVLAQLPQPLALIEVGASAGLCLLPDLYAYDYAGKHIHPPAGTEPPVFQCVANTATPLPTAVPKIVWRAGLDLNPLDITDPTQAAWLETLVWPEQTERLENLRSAMRVAASAPPRVVKGSLLGDDLARLCQQAPGDATLVVFHTAVLAYISDPTARQEFAERVTSLCPYWIANESPRVLPEISAQTGPGPIGHFLLSVNGSPVAWTDPHGAAIDWIA